MKKSLLALAVAAMAASSVASAATVYEKDGDTLAVYGRVQGVLYSTDQASLNSYNDNSLQASGRLGFDMRTQVMPGVAAFAKMEWDVADGTRGDGGEWGVRYAFLGLDFGQYGLIKGGRFEDALKYVLSATDIFDDYGCYGLFGDDPKRDGIIMYSWSGYGFDVNASFQTAADEQGMRYAKYDVDHAYAISAGYKSAPVLFGPIAVKAGYNFTQTQVEDSKKGANPALTGADNIQGYAVSASWGDLAQGPYIGATYNEQTVEMFQAGDKDFEGKGFEVAVAYGFANGVSVRTAYMYKNLDNGTVDAVAKVMPVYVNYQMNPRFNVWAEARFDVGTDDKNDKVPFTAVGGESGLDEHVYSVGARYTF